MTGRPPGKRRKRELANAYRQLHDRVAAILYRHDPAGIGFGDNADEYEPEAGTILARLPSATSQQDARRMAAW